MKDSHQLVTELMKIKKDDPDFAKTISNLLLYNTPVEMTVVPNDHDRTIRKPKKLLDLHHSVHDAIELELEAKEAEKAFFGLLSKEVLYILNPDSHSKHALLIWPQEKHGFEFACQCSDCFNTKDSESIEMILKRAKEMSEVKKIIFHHPKIRDSAVSVEDVSSHTSEISLGVEIASQP